MTTATTKISIPAGDYGYDLAFTCYDKSGDVYILTGYTIHFKAWSYDSPGTLLVDSAGVIDDALNGKCHYTLASGDFDDEGTFEAELQLEKAGVIESFPSFVITVTESAL